MKKFVAVMVSVFAISGLALANESMEASNTQNMEQGSSMNAESNTISIQKAKKGKKGKKHAKKHAKKHGKKHHDEAPAADAAAAPAAPAADAAAAPAAH